ncbi:sulfotransferase domain-containing protein [Sulfitobacter sp.]|uniref:sulfotransferase domain-containing protein n=1 Tax=Sulfitobacter sp. TaxID=1903071 RepID=UPI003EF57F44
MQSIIALSMHKAGSSIADRIFTKIAKERGYELDLISRRSSDTPLSEPEFYREYEPQMKTEGMYFGMARHPGCHDLEILPKLRTLVQVRDPRDCITSMYFSFTKSHVPPSDPTKLAAFEASRARLQALDIDEWAIKESSRYLKRLEKLEAVVNTNPGVQLLTYEEMVENTPAWAEKVLTFFDQPMTPRLERMLAGDLDFSVSAEDASQHKRQVSPGDHRRKLKPETIEQMNEVLGPAMRNFGYSV